MVEALWVDFSEWLMLTLLALGNGFQNLLDAFIDLNVYCAARQPAFVVTGTQVFHKPSRPKQPIGWLELKVNRQGQPNPLA